MRQLTLDHLNCLPNWMSADDIASLLRIGKLRTRLIMWRNFDGCERVSRPTFAKWVMRSRYFQPIQY